LLPDSLNALNASFAQNREERRNFAAHDGLKKTHDAAMAIIEKRYGTRPARISFSAARQETRVIFRCATLAQTTTTEC